MSLTEYVVLVHNRETNTWREIHGGEYRSPDAAKKAGAEEHGAGNYVAVPVRSWKPDSYVGHQMTVWEIAPAAVETAA